MATGHVFENLRDTNEKLTGPPARKLVEKAHVFDGPFQDVRVLDNACGGGILTRQLFDVAHQSQTKTSINRIVAADIDERMLAYVKQLSEESAWRQVETMRFDQADVPLENGSFTHVLSSFGIFFSLDDNKVLSETLRILQPDGVAGFTSWKYLGWWHDITMPVLEKCFPDAPILPHPSAIFPSKGESLATDRKRSFCALTGVLLLTNLTGWNDAEIVRGKMEAAGLADVDVEELSFTPETEATSFAAACAFLVRGMTARLWPPEINQKYAERIEPEMRQFIEWTYEGGRWTGGMVALVATGRKRA